MKSFIRILLLLVMSSPILHAQEGKKMDVDVSSAVLKTAEWAGFKYMENLDLAISGNTKAIKELVEFSGTVDGTEALQHGVTCIELIPLVSDEKFGSVVSSLKPKLKTVLLNRFQLAQGRSKKEELHKPMQEWAPQTWKALNGEKVNCGSCMHEGERMSNKPPVSKPGAPAVQSSDNEASGKQ